VTSAQVRFCNTALNPLAAERHVKPAHLEEKLSILRSFDEKNAKCFNELVF